MPWIPPEIDSTDIETWKYTERDKHFWPAEGLVPEDAKLIIDIGCNAGFSTGLLADAYPKAKVIGVEMVPHVADRARVNVRGFRDRVEIITAAVGWPEREEGAIFNIANAVSRLRPYEIPHTGYTTYPTVQVISLDHILQKTNNSFKKINYLKMDIEGAEYEVLRDGGIWPTYVDVIGVEPHVDSRDKLEEILISFGFKITNNHYGMPIGYRENELRQRI